MPFQDLPDVRLYYELEGSGARLLVISGTGGDLRDRPRLTEGPLVERFEVLAYDQRGLGQSSVPPGPYTMAQYADDAAGLLDAVGWDSCAVLGLSFGGMVAQELAIRHPDRVRRLALACTSAGGVGGSSYPLHELAVLSPEESLAIRMEILDTRWDAEWRRTHPEVVEGMSKRFLQRTADQGVAADGLTLQLEARSHHDTADRLGQIRCPTYVCGGRFDGTALPANSEYLAAHIPGAELAMFDGGHIFVVQDPTAIPAIVEFLGR
ncbi:MAG TPA: alpha/beta hydrolase [Acidimicrobiales bacterium]|jgi:3-oxoadipate enol-lactonase